ncbi:MAG: hypothetical protein NTZ12_06400, partial [Candidatus Aminicenantes bacterium]|nr:hypothetical protein [Candidatus Aminicenantes bacterium]
MKITKIVKLDPERPGTIVIPLFRGLAPTAVSAIGREFPELAELLQQKKTLPKNGDALFFHAASGRRQFFLIAAGRGNRPTDARSMACRIMLQLREK